MTREDAIREIEELEKDLLAFKRSRDVLYTRLREMDDDPERREMLIDWPGMKVVDNGLIMAIVRCEGLIEDHRHLLEQMEIPNNVLPFGEES